MFIRWLKQLRVGRPQAGIHRAVLDKTREVVCFGISIAGHEEEEFRANQVIGRDITADFESVKIFIAVKAGYIYAHSNYVQKGRRFPTKLSTNRKVSLELIAGNLVATHKDFRRSEYFYPKFFCAYVTQFRYFVDETVLFHPYWSSLDFTALRNVSVVTGQKMDIVPLEQWKKTNTKGIDNMTTNNVTFTLGPGATFTSSIAIGHEIQQIFGSASATSDVQLRSSLEDLVRQVTKLIEVIPGDEMKNDVSQHLATFVEQAKKEQPSRSLLKVTSDGLLEAAKTVALMAPPITTAVQAVLSLLGMAA